jgi:CHAT domain-containing protein
VELHGDPLKLEDVFSKTILRNNVLTVLNGCESGLLLPHALDDYHNFTTGFLFAGAPCVITTLWTVPDFTSALIMDEFYRHFVAGVAPATALKFAQHHVRTLRRGSGIDAAVDKLTEALNDPVAAMKRREDAHDYVRNFGDAGDWPFASPVHWAAFTCNGLGFRLLGDSNEIAT